MILSALKQPKVPRASPSPSKLDEMGLKMITSNFMTNLIIDCACATQPNPTTRIPSKYQTFSVGNGT